jgi:hypothetical protein
MKCPLHAVIVAALLSALPAPAVAAPPDERPLVLALNPQPEPPGRTKIKRVYVKQDDSRRPVKTLKQKPNVVTPATKY